MTSKTYTVVFAFSEGRVLLRRKTHPEWQNGLWNGLGGRADLKGYLGDPHPMAAASARAKFTQEAGIEVPQERFTTMIRLSFPEAAVFILHLDLTESEAKHVGTYERDDSGEFNRWFDQDEINALINEDTVALSQSSIEHNDEPPYAVDSALALLDLVHAMIPWWDGTVEDE